MKYWEKVDPGMRGTDPAGDAATLAAAALLAKALMIKGAAAGVLKGGKNLLKNEVSKMTISDAAFKKGLLPQLTRGGIKNWQHLRPFKAFTPKMLATGPTPAAAVGTAGAAGLLIKNKKKK